MIEWLDGIDKQLFLFFNGQHSQVSDQVWYWITWSKTWIPLYALFLILLIKTFRMDSIWLIAGVLLTVLITDQVTSSLMKPFFERLRPCYDPEIGHLVHVVKGCGGKFGFASGHSANSFGIATFAWLTFRYYWRWTWLIFLWSAAMAFSRIMVGVHYPADIIVGAAVGILSGWLMFRIISEIYFRTRLEPVIKN